MDIYNLVSLAGIFALMAIAWVLSADRRRLNWRCLAFGTGLQIALGLIVFHAPGSTKAFLWLNDAVVRLLAAATAGQKFLFGPLALGPGEVGPGGEKSVGFILALQALPVIIFFSALMGLLYYWGIMPLVIRGFAWLFGRLMRVSGAMAGVKLVVGIVALLIALLGLLAVVDLGLGLLGEGCEAAVNRLAPAVGADGRVDFQWSLGGLLGYVMGPLAVLTGVPPADAGLAGSLLGERLVATEVPAYIHLAEAMRQGRFTHPRSPMLIAYALCGFAHVASLAIFVGGIAALVPQRRKDLAAVGPRALLAATLACLMTAAVAGTFFHGPEWAGLPPATASTPTSMP